MSSPFHFRHFSIRHDRCAMAVGTDAVLLGAWAELPATGRLLDIGCGSGIISLMAAQRSKLEVVGVEVDKIAAIQATENVENSPFADRVTIVTADIRSYRPNLPFDAVVSNPPYFEEELLPPDVRRAAARHTSHLGFEELIDRVTYLLRPEGRFSVILPHPAMQRFTLLCAAKGLNLIRHTQVVTVPGKEPKRSLLTYQNGFPDEAIRSDTLTLSTPDRKRSEVYERLTRDFYIQ